MRERPRRVAAGLTALGIALGAAACAGNGPVRPPSSFEGSAGAVSSAGATAGGTTAEPGLTTAARTASKPTAAPTAALSAEDAVRRKLQSGKMADMYKTTYESLFSRVNAAGYFQESVTGRYRGEYVRSVGALVKLALETGETDAAARALRFVTDTMVKRRLSWFPFTISADQKTVRREDEPDGRAHFVLGWALYARQAGPSAYENDTYAMVAAEMDALLSAPYFHGQGAKPSMNLLLNSRFTHTRMKNGGDYWNCFDTLTNHFAAAAADNMAAVAERRGDTPRAAAWREKRDVLALGIRQNLTRTVDGKPVYLELQTKSGNKAAPETGLSWVCLSPAAAEFSGADPDVLSNTARLLYKTLWKTEGSGGYLAVEAEADGTVKKDWILGKSVGWDIDAARLAGDYAHIAAWFAFLEKHHTGSLFMEKMKRSGVGWQVVDAGNGEQCIWFVWAMARLRRELGLPARP